VRSKQEASTGSARPDAPRKVLYFTDNLGFGGTENVMLTMFSVLDRTRWEPVLVHRPSSEFDRLDDLARQLDVRVWPVSQMMEGKRDSAWVLPVARAFRAEKPAVFHFHRTAPNQGTYGLLAAICARVPAVVVTQHHLSARTSMVRRLQEMAISSGVDRHTTVSHEVARRLRPRCLFPSRIQVIHNGIQLQPFGGPANVELRAFLSKGTGRPIVLCVSRLEATEKGLRFLVSAATMVPEAQFILAGEGREREALEAQARSLGVHDRVTLLGYWKDLPVLLASCDLFVLPSLCEGFGLSIAEAMASGKPVVASAIGGVNEVVVDGETGFLVTPGDPAALASGIRTLLSDPNLAERMGTAGKLRVHREFSAETMVGRTTRLYDELLGLNGHNP
jgi:glycosyltransferase involved in cell wall biosynthesis